MKTTTTRLKKILTYIVLESLSFILSFGVIYLPFMWGMNLILTLNRSEAQTWADIMLLMVISVFVLITIYAMIRYCICFIVWRAMRKKRD